MGSETRGVFFFLFFFSPLLHNDAIIDTEAAAHIRQTSKSLHANVILTCALSPIPYSSGTAPFLGIAKLAISYNIRHHG